MRRVRTTCFVAATLTICLLALALGAHGAGTEAYFTPLGNYREASSDASRIAGNAVNTTLDDAGQCPCTNRQKIKIVVAAHGRSTDSFWDLVHLSAVQMAEDLRVQLTWKRPVNLDEVAQAAAIDAAIADGADAIITTMASAAVLPAVQRALDAGIPVVNMNSIPSDVDPRALGLLHHVGQVETEAGRLTGLRLAELGASKLLVVNHEPSNTGLQLRIAGIEESAAFVNKTVESVVTQELADELRATVRAVLEGDPDIDAVVTFGAGVMGELMSVLDALAPRAIFAATFDTNDAVLSAINAGKVSFAVDQQQVIQGSHAVLLAATYVVTGQRIDNTVINSGPGFITAESTGPLVCNAALSGNHDRSWCDAATDTCRCVNGRTCAVTEACPVRKQLRVVVAAHGSKSDFFWDLVQKAAQDAGRDFGAAVAWTRPDSQDNIVQTAQIDQAVADGADAIVVTFPDPEDPDDPDNELKNPVKFAVMRAVSAGIPVTSMNSGYELSRKVGAVHHVGQGEYEAGYVAGERYCAEGISRVLLINHRKSIQTLLDRARGFRDALVDCLPPDNVPNVGPLADLDTETCAGGIMVHVPLGDYTTARPIIFNALACRPDTQGILALGTASYVPLMSALRTEGAARTTDDVKVATFDVGHESVPVDLASGALDFAIDQQEYLQGYLSVALAIAFAHSHQFAADPLIRSGPGFVTGSNVASKDCYGGPDKFLNVDCACAPGSVRVESRLVCEACPVGTYWRVPEDPAVATATCVPCGADQVCEVAGLAAPGARDSGNGAGTWVGVGVGVAVAVAGAALGALYYLKRSHKQAQTSIMQQQWAVVELAELEFGDVIGSGSFGTVYRGSFRGTTVAIKKINEDVFRLTPNTSHAGSSAATNGAASRSSTAARTVHRLGEGAGGDGGGGGGSSARSGDTATNKTKAGILSRLRSANNNAAARTEVLDFQAEINTMCKLRHPNVLLFMGSCRAPDICIITEFMEKGTLHDILHAERDVPLRRKVLYSLNAALGMTYLHENDPQILHADLKAMNLFVDANDMVKVADFGLARFKKRGDDKIDLGGRSVGSYFWMAVEVIDGIEFTAGSDVFSFAVTMWEIWNQRLPYYGPKGQLDIETYRFLDSLSEEQRADLMAMDVIDALLNAVVDDHMRPEFPDDVLPAFRDLVFRCWAADPKARPSFREIAAELNGIKMSVSN